MSEDVEGKETIELLREGIKSLSEKDRTFITLFYYEGMDYKEISYVWKCGIAEVSKTHQKILKLLKSGMEKKQ